MSERKVPFEKFKVGDFVQGKSSPQATQYKCFWRVHVTPAPQSDSEYYFQRGFIEQAIREKLEQQLSGKEPGA